MTRKRKKHATYAEWFKAMDKHHRRQKRKDANKRDWEYQIHLRFSERPIRYNRAAARLLSRLANHILTMRDGVFQQKRTWSKTFSTKFGLVTLSTRTGGTDTQRIKKRRSSLVREQYTIDGFSVDTSKCLTTFDEGKELHNIIEDCLTDITSNVRPVRHGHRHKLPHKPLYEGHCDVTERNVYIPKPLESHQGTKYTKNDKYWDERMPQGLSQKEETIFRSL